MQLWQEVAMWATIAGVPVLMAAYFRGALRAWRFADAYLPRENRLLLVLAGILSLSAVAQYLALRLTPVACCRLRESA